MGQPGERQYGGAGLMIKKPDLVIELSPAQDFSATGLMADKAIAFAHQFAKSAVQTGLADRVDPVEICVVHAPRAHTGLGTGTQLGMAVARAMAEMIGRDDLSVAQLALMVERGKRSAIGTYGFEHGGFIVEGGKLNPEEISPLLLHQPSPSDWRFVLITPQSLQGLADDREIRAFAKLPPIPRDVSAEMCRLLLLELVPAMKACDVQGFGEALYELQQHVGRTFAAAQGGIYADPLLDQIVQFVRDQGTAGVGQSSWGPTLYAVTACQEQAEQLAAQIVDQFDLPGDQVQITEADNRGMTLHQHEITASSR